MAYQSIETLIIGAGLSGLSTAYFIKKSAPEKNVIILESGEYAGGMIKTSRSNGYIAEYGPHGFLNNVEESRELLSMPGLKNRICSASLKTFLRYVCLKGALEPIPQHPLKLLTSPVMPFSGKLRVLGDLVHPPQLKEQTIAEWAEQRFGKAILPLVDCAFTGTYGGDIHKLSIDAVMPGVREMELKSGSVIKGILKKLLFRKEKKGKKPRQMPSMINFKGGMEELVDALKENQTILCNQPVTEIQKDTYGWIVRSKERQFLAKQLVIATSINQALPLLTLLNIPPGSNIPEARIANVVLGFGQSAQVPHGFGFLAPKIENRFVLGAMFSSHMFKNRTPDGNILMEALVGGRHYPERVDMEDKKLIEATVNDLKKLLYLPEKPLYSRVLRYSGGIPQLELGHQKFLKYRKMLEDQYKDLRVTGFGWRAIGMNDMIKDAKHIADYLVNNSPQMDQAEKIKPIYF